MRIVSLVPSQTELLYDLGLDEEVVGITKFCIHPENWFRTKTRVGGTKTVNIEKVKSLSPDLIIANKEENVKEQVDELAVMSSVYTSDISNLAEAMQMIKDIGKLVQKEEKANEIVKKIRNDFEDLSTFTDQLIGKSTAPLKTTYLIWKDPYMAAGGDTFISDIMNRCGFVNVLHKQQRYPEVTIPQLAEMNCQLLLLSSEPYPFKQKHIDELQVQLPGTKILTVDGEMFSWYGSRLLHAAEYFKLLINQIHRHH